MFSVVNAIMYIKCKKKYRVKIDVRDDKMYYWQ